MKKITAVLLALAMVFAFAACGGGKEKEPEVELPAVNAVNTKFDSVNLKINGNVLPADKIAALQVYEVKLDKILDKDGNPATDKKTGEPLVVTYTGYKIADLLQAAGISGKTVYGSASDGYESDEYELAKNPDHLIVAVLKDGEPAADGTLFFAPCFEQTNGKFVRALVELVVK